MADGTRHHLSRALRTMHGLVEKKILNAAADELDRLNSLIAGMVSSAAAKNRELRMQIRALEDRVCTLNRGRDESVPPNDDSR